MVLRYFLQGNYANIYDVMSTETGGFLDTTMDEKLRII